MAVDEGGLVPRAQSPEQRATHQARLLPLNSPSYLSALPFFAICLYSGSLCALPGTAGTAVLPWAQPTTHNHQLPTGVADPPQRTSAAHILQSLQAEYNSIHALAGQVEPCEFVRSPTSFLRAMLGFHKRF